MHVFQILAPLCWANEAELSYRSVHTIRANVEQLFRIRITCAKTYVSCYCICRIVLEMVKST